MQRAVAEYVDDVQAAAAEDASLWALMYAVMFGMTKGPEAFFAFDVVLKVLLWRMRRVLGHLAGKDAASASISTVAARQ